MPIMKVEVLFFAAARDAAGMASTTLDVPAGTTASAALARLGHRHPALAALAASLRVAVNEDFVEGEHVLVEGDRLALIPPVSGG